MGLKELIAAKLATGEAHCFKLTRHVTTTDIPNGQALLAAFSPGATWANVACVGVFVGMAGSGLLGLYRPSLVSALTTAGGFDADYLTDMPSVPGVSASYEISVPGFLRGIRFNDDMHMDLWDSPIIIKSGANGGMVRAAIHNDSGAAKGYTLVLMMVAWQ